VTVTDDPGAPSYDDALDDLAARLFAGDAASRVAPLLRRFEAEVGPLHADDPQYELWHALRLDWAMCDASLDHPGDTWAWRAVTGTVPGVAASAVDGTVARSIAGVFEVWPGREPWLRELTRGICLPLADHVRLEPVVDDGPAALWGLRICVAAQRAFLCRPPLPFPLAATVAIREAARRRLANGEDLLLKLYRAWLQHARATRADADGLFRAVLSR
jgi:hypothetical protein